MADASAEFFIKTKKFKQKQPHEHLQGANKTCQNKSNKIWQTHVQELELKKCAKCCSDKEQVCVYLLTCSYP